MRIGELSRRTGVPERLLRYYEQQGLLEPTRCANGYREYGEGDVALVRRIRRLLAAGLGTTAIAAALPCLRDDGQRLIPVCPGVVSDLRRERDRMTEAIARLHGTRAALDLVIEAAGPDGS